MMPQKETARQFKAVKEKARRTKHAPTVSLLKHPDEIDPPPTLSVKTDKGRVFSHIRQKWLVETPEERVRQAYVVTLHNEYGFDLDQMDEELHVAGRGFGPRAGRRGYLAHCPRQGRQQGPA